MKLSDLMDYVHNNPRLVTLKESKRHPGLFVIKYKKAVFYDNLWDSFLEECRGLVVTGNEEIAALPFRKIYNYGIDPQSPVFSDRATCSAYRKINGFMLAVTRVNGELVVSTTGSLDSEFCRYGEELITQLLDPLAFHATVKEGKTYLFEAVHPADPHIIPERTGLYFIGSRIHDLSSDVDIIPREVDGFEAAGCRPVECFATTVGGVKEMAKTCQHEGFVFYTINGAAKIKSPYYLAAKLFARAGNLDRLLNGKAKELLDEEYYGLITSVGENRDEFKNLSEQERLAWIRRFFGKIYN